LTTLQLDLPPVSPEWRTPMPEELFRLLDTNEMRLTGAEARRRYPVAVPAPPPASQAQQGELF
jgi:hypothetical protein